MPAPIHASPSPLGIAQESLTVRLIALKNRHSKFDWWPFYFGLIGGLAAYSVNSQLVYPYSILLIAILGLHDAAKRRAQEQLELLDDLASELDRLRSLRSSTDH